MMSEVKMIRCLMKYGYGYTGSIVIGMIWLLLTLAFVAFESIDVMGGYSTLLYMTSPIILTSGFASLEASSFVSASGKRKMVALTGAAKLSIISVAVVYMLALSVISFQVTLFGDGENYAGGVVLCLGISAFITLIYMSYVNKSRIFGIAFFGVFYGGFGVVASFIIDVLKPAFATGLVFGLLFFVFGAVLHYLIRLLLYKRPVSRYAFGGEVRGNMR